MSTMLLWSWHEPDFSLTSGHVDLSRSPYYRKLPTIPDAYATLEKHVGTNQIIWCYVSPDEYIKLPGLSRVEWVLDVPDEKVLAIIDKYTWERIIGTKAYPPSLREQWTHEAIQGDHDYEPYVQMKVDEYLAVPPPAGGWWTVLFKDTIDGEDTSVLLQHPIPQEWVVRAG